MSIAQAETLKRGLTDKYVVVHEGVAELRRFVGLTGQVKTINMNARALVQFDNPVDISWYDIDPAFLRVVEAPAPKSKEHAKPAAEPKAQPAKTAPATAGMSAIEILRASKPGATTATAAPAAPAAAAPVGEKKLSPIEILRQQAAAAKAAAAKPETVTEHPVGAETAAEPGGPAPAPVTPPPEVAAAAQKPAPAKPGSTADIIAMLRKQKPPTP